VVKLQRERCQLPAAADAFLAQPDLMPSSRRSYAQTLGRLVRELGGEAEVAEIDPNQLEFVFRQAWAGVAATTWNRHLAALRSFVGYCQLRGWLVDDPTLGLERRPEKADLTRVLSFPELERIWSRDGVELREKCLWRFLYETAARAEEVLSLNVEDVDVGNKRAVAVSKGGDREFLHFQTGSARLLPRLIGGRQRGPLFLSDRPPVPSRAPAAADLCPVTGRARLSYRRAEELFKAASGGRTLHDLRRAALTHLGEENVSLPLLMAKSRHKNLRSLQRYVRPSPDAVAALTAAHDPARRRR
jgi:integrase